MELDIRAIIPAMQELRNIRPFHHAAFLPRFRLSFAAAS
jgi:hypothetical protein